MSGEEEKQEIIIVKRGGGGGDGHHGGAWKIAFADFMTEMKALFLVLWLVNAANEKTKKSVASYFNPVKLIDRTRSTKGLEETTVHDLPTEEETEEDQGSEKSDEEAEVSELSAKEEDFFKDPFSVLDELAKEQSEKIEVAMSVSNEFFEASPDQEDALLDPFAEEMTPPDQQVAQSTQNVEVPSALNENGEASSDQGVVDQRGLDSPVRLDNFVLSAALNIDSQEGEPVDPQRAQELADSEEESDPSDQTKLPNRGMADEENKKDPLTEAEKKAAEEKKAVAEAEKKAAEEKKALAEARAAAEKREEAAKKVEQAAEEIREEIKERLIARLGKSEQISESLTVKITEDGVLISITDQFGFSMFQVGSAIPKGEVVLAMAEISTVLAERQGKVRVYGHTDGRPYAGDSYDNWRLSTARAHAARLMLERGGLREARVSQVVGFSDRVLRVPSDPEADENRRIEILLEVL